MRWTVILALGMLGTLTLCGCSTSGAQPLDLANTSWRLTSFGDGGTARAPVGTVPLTMNITRDAGLQLAGTSGCNQYNAPLTFDGTSFEIGVAMSTMMACVEPGIMEQEAAYLAALTATRSAHGAIGELHLLDASGTTLLVFAPAAQP
jgi:heat shock protein HslJ